MAEPSAPLAFAPPSQPAVPKAGRRAGRGANLQAGGLADDAHVPMEEPTPAAGPPTTIPFGQAAADGGAEEEGGAGEAAAQEQEPPPTGGAAGMVAALTTNAAAADSRPPPPQQGFMAGNEGNKLSGVSRRKSQMMEQQAAQAEAERMGTTDGRNPDRTRHSAPDTEEIIEIPELEEEEEEDITRQVAAPPQLQRRNVQTLKELDNDIAFNLPVGATAEPEVDLSLLTSRLLAADAVEEAPDAWDFEQVHQEVAQDISAQARLRAEEEEAQNAAPAAAP